MSIVAASSISTTFVSSALSGAGTHNTAKRVAELKETIFSNMATGSAAAIQGIKAASIQGNKVAGDFAAGILRERLDNNTSIQALARSAANNTSADRFNISTTGSQLFRLFLSDLRGQSL